MNHEVEKRGEEERQMKYDAVFIEKVPILRYNKHLKVT